MTERRPRWGYRNPCAASTLLGLTIRLATIRVKTVANEEQKEQLSLCHGKPMKTVTVCYTKGYAMIAPVAQMDRATGFEPVGRGFDPLRAHHT
jgi:hypothetical protein